jgi:hypothetical protein
MSDNLHSLNNRMLAAERSFLAQNQKVIDLINSGYDRFPAGKFQKPDGTILTMIRDHNSFHHNLVP